MEDTIHIQNISVEEINKDINNTIYKKYETLMKNGLMEKH